MDERLRMTNSRSPAGRDDTGRFGSGNSGRPFGARGRTSAKIALGILKHFERNSDVILDRLMRDHPPAYAGLLGRMVPRDGAVAPSAVDEVSDSEVRTKLNSIRVVLGGGGDERALLVDVEAVLFSAAAASTP